MNKLSKKKRQALWDDESKFLMPDEVQKIISRWGDGKEPTETEIASLLYTAWKSVGILSSGQKIAKKLLEQADHLERFLSRDDL